MATLDSLHQTYDKAFFASQVDGSARSARLIVPLLLDFCPGTRSVVDVGCGTGVWLARFKEAGIEHVLGLDGGSAGDHGQLEIAVNEFESADFEQKLPAGSRFDLCICLEMAEHLTPDAAPALVASLCGLSDVIAFSAALPGQGGTMHLNERWPSYWAALFAAHGYQPIDAIRRRVWHEARIEWWYRQNIVLFVNAPGLERLGISNERIAQQWCGPLDIVHPECFSIFRNELERAQRGATSPQPRVAELSAENALLKTHIAALCGQRDAYAVELAAIAHSTSWKLTYPLRRSLQRRPGVKRFFRRVAYFTWWSITGQLARRLRDRRAERERRAGAKALH